jgi:hypothetical protein
MFGLVHALLTKVKLYNTVWPNKRNNCGSDNIKIKFTVGRSEFIMPLRLGLTVLFIYIHKVLLHSEIADFTP